MGTVCRRQHSKMFLTNRFGKAFLLLTTTMVKSQSRLMEASEECCTTKMVGNISYTLLQSAASHGPIPQQCLNNCVYTVTAGDGVDGDTGASKPKFCFQRGDLPTHCLSDAQASFPSTSKEVTIHVARKFGGVTSESLVSAFEEAQSYFLQDRTTKVRIYLEAGTHYINDTLHLNFNSTQLGPSKGGRLIIEGAGCDNTTLLYPPENFLLNGTNVNHLTVRNLHFNRTRKTTSQGIVEEVGKGWVKVNVEKGYPRIDEIFDNTTHIAGHPDHGRWLRRYVMNDGSCQIVQDNNEQVGWSNYTWLGNQNWKLYLDNRFQRPNYRKGELLGIKSKCCGAGETAFYINKGKDIVFESVTFSRQARVVFRWGASNLRFSDINIRRDSERDCLSTSTGGPQIGHPADPEYVFIHNVTVENLRAHNTGDDSVAFFNVASGGVIRDCNLRDSFARGILLNNSPTTLLKDNRLVRCPIVYNNKTGDA